MEVQSSPIPLTSIFQPDKAPRYSVLKESLRWRTKVSRISPKTLQEKLVLSDGLERAFLSSGGER